jgi:hypothetical protein
LASLLCRGLLGDQDMVLGLFAVIARGLLEDGDAGET